MLEALPAEQQPIAQQLLRGGIPAVRTALHFERERAREEGRPEPSTEGVLALAESLVSKVKAAEWRDRAEAAVKAGDDLVMRDLRSLVNGSDVARDEASRDLVIALREMLENRVEAHRVAWAAEVTSNLDDGHVVRALRLSSHPPDPAARFSAELATRLRDAAGTALASDTPPDRWLAVLQAVVESPVRRTVKPQALPHGSTPELLEAARQQCGRVPALAALLGISVPPPPGPARAGLPIKPPPRHTTRLSRPPRPAARPGAAPSRAPRATAPGAATPVPDEVPAHDEVPDQEQIPESVSPGAAFQPASATDDLPAAEAAVAAQGEPVVVDDVPTVADEVPVVADEVPVVADDVPTVADDVPVVADDVPPVREDEPAVADERLAGPAPVPATELDGPEAVTAEGVEGTGGEGTEGAEELRSAVPPGAQPALD